jgi:Lon protease-like protein
VVTVEGGERFRLLRFTEGRSFRTGEIEAVVDGEGAAGDGERRTALELFEGLRDAVGAEVESPEVDDPELSFAIARRIEMDARVKQELIESVSEPERLEILTSHLRSAHAQLELVQEHSALARRNGNLRSASSDE